jgi:hypothetical protein
MEPEPYNKFTQQSRQLHAALKPIANSTLFYKAFHPILNAAAKINNHIEIQKSYRYHLEFKSYCERIAGILSPSKCVLSGPFQGLQYPSLQASGSALILKILGVYESELHTDIEALRESYECILDIGCAEGYYAVGLARMHQGATVHAYDIDPDAARKTIDMAALNNVSNRLEIHGGASWQDLLTVSNQKALIVCDCEGHERFLFSHQNIRYLADCDLIIELHPFVCEDVATYLLSLF